jgi:hypothetical protein
MFVPAGKPFANSDEVCRVFLATVVGRAMTLSLQGTACRPSGGEWMIRTVAPRAGSDAQTGFLHDDRSGRARIIGVA